MSIIFNIHEAGAAGADLGAPRMSVAATPAADDGAPMSGGAAASMIVAAPAGGAGHHQTADGGPPAEALVQEVEAALQIGRTMASLGQGGIVVEDSDAGAAPLG